MMRLKNTLVCSHDLVSVRFASIIKEIPLLTDIPTSEIHIQQLAGLTNKNYRLSVADSQYVLRIPCKKTNENINRINESFNYELAEKLGIAPKLVWREVSKEDAPTGVCLVEYLDKSQEFSHEIDEIEAEYQLLKNLASTISTLQKSQKSFEGIFDVSEIKQSLTQYFNLCTREQQVKLIDDYQQVQAILTTLQNRPNYSRNSRKLVPSHVDLVLENILVEHNNHNSKNNKIWLIDWEYSAMASPFWDIATVCNSANLSDEASAYFLKQVILDSSEEDLDLLKKYQVIIKSLSACWHTAFT